MPEALPIKQARFPHELFMVNLLIFHLLMAPAAIALGIGRMGMLLPLLLSLSTMAYTRWRAGSMAAQGEFVSAHWQLALQRYRRLLIAYAVAAALLGLGWLIAQGSSDANMRDIIQTVFIRIAVMPVLVMVMISAYLESNAIKLASSGEMPEQGGRSGQDEDE